MSSLGGLDDSNASNATAPALSGWNQELFAQWTWSFALPFSITLALSFIASCKVFRWRLEWGELVWGTTYFKPIYSASNAAFRGTAVAANALSLFLCLLLPALFLYLWGGHVCRL